jgi:hypothetical protein
VLLHDVAAMNNMIAAAQEIFCSWPQQIMRVGDDAYPEHEYICAPSLV